MPEFQSPIAESLDCDETVYSTAKIYLIIRQLHILKFHFAPT